MKFKIKNRFTLATQATILLPLWSIIICQKIRKILLFQLRLIAN